MLKRVRELNSMVETKQLSVVEIFSQTERLSKELQELFPKAAALVNIGIGVNASRQRDNIYRSFTSLREWDSQRDECLQNARRVGIGHTF